MAIACGLIFLAYRQEFPQASLLVLKVQTREVATEVPISDVTRHFGLYFINKKKSNIGQTLAVGKGTMPFLPFCLLPPSFSGHEEGEPKA